MAVDVVHREIPSVDILHSVSRARTCLRPCPLVEQPRDILTKTPQCRLVNRLA